jgi:pyruvate,water dikinase
VAFVVPLADASDAGTVGGKAASLGELTRAGVAVPAGFAVTTEAFAAVMAAADADGALRAGIGSLPASGLAEIGRTAARFRGVVARTPLPAGVAAAIEAEYADLGGASDVAVRSSSTAEDSSEASFAGLQDTYLGVSGAAGVLDHVRRCWASLYNDESVAYRRRLGLPESGVAMAVVVQLMVAPRAAGVMFTRSPVTGDRSVVAIEGTWGLGSALVSGDVTPDSWVTSKVTGEITARRVSSKANTRPELRDAPCLTDEEIHALAAVARRVEAHYGTPQDIEWAVLDAPFAAATAADSPAESRVVLLQSRPETVWAARDARPAGTPRPRAADHVLALFGKPLRSGVPRGPDQ